MEDTSSEEPLFTLEQKRILGILPMITAPLSIVGSSLIAYVLISDKKAGGAPSFRRLMMGLCCFDICYSSNFLIFGSWATPEGSDAAYRNAGNVATCTVSGFFTHMLLGSMLYTAGLAVFYCLTVVYKWKELRFAKRIEPFMHALAVVFPLVTGVYAVVNDLMNPLTLFPGVCWIHDYPDGCWEREDVECERGGDYRPLAFVCGTAWTFLLLIVLFFCLLRVFLFVRATEKRLQQYGMGANSQLRLTRKAGIAGIRYVGAFGLAFFALVVTQVVDREQSRENRAFFLTLSTAAVALNPLHGFFNAIVFFVDRYDVYSQPGHALSWIERGSQLVSRSMRRPQKKQRREKRETSNTEDGEEYSNNNVVSYNLSAVPTPIVDLGIQETVTAAPRTEEEEEEEPSPIADPGIQEMVIAAPRTEEEEVPSSPKSISGMVVEPAFSA